MDNADGYYEAHVTVKVSVFVALPDASTNQAFHVSVLVGGELPVLVHHSASGHTRGFALCVNEYCELRQLFTLQTVAEYSAVTGKVGSPLQ